MSNTKGLKILGAKKTVYPSKPNAQILETFENEHVGEGFHVVPFKCNEFTSLCPKTKQPDFARLEILYVPYDLMVESKSLKLYLFSFRNHGAFHEDVIFKITNDLYNILDPFYIRVIGDFNVRGGISIKPIVDFWGIEDDNDGIPDVEAKRQIERIVEQWDRVKSNLSE